MRAAIYARYSSNNQREESIDAQIRAITDFADKNNYTIVKTFIDEARSATNDDRPQFLEMINAAKSNLFDVILCHKLDRFARNKYDSAFYKKILKDHDIKLISVLEYLDDSPESIILESILEGMAEYYSKNLAREVKKGLKENALECKHTGGKPPFGYDVDSNKKYIINEHEAKAVRKIFEMVCNLFSAGEILDWLRANNYKTKYNTSFTLSSINSIIRNEKYKGTYIYGKTKRVRVNGVEKNLKNPDAIVIENGIPAIVIGEQWDTANDIYDTRVKISGGQAKAKEVYLLSGLIKCGKCGGSMCGNRVYSGRNKNLRITYQCATRKAKKECDAKDIRKDLVEAIVLNDIEHMLSTSGIDLLIDKLTAIINENSKELPDEIKAAKIQKTKVDSQIESLLQAIMDGMYNQTLKQKMNDLELEKQILIDKITFMEKQKELLKIPTREFLEEMFKQDMDIKNKSMEDKKRIIAKYVKKVVVYEGLCKTYLDLDMDTSNGGSAPYLVSTSEYGMPINQQPYFYRINIDVCLNDENRYDNS